MNIGIISARYAKALYDYACKMGVEDEVYREMGSISAVFVKLPRLREALVNPVISRNDCMKLIRNSLLGWILRVMLELAIKVSVNPSGNNWKLRRKVLVNGARRNTPIFYDCLTACLISGEI